MQYDRMTMNDANGVSDGITRRGRGRSRSPQASSRNIPTRRSRSRSPHSAKTKKTTPMAPIAATAAAEFSAFDMFPNFVDFGGNLFSDEFAVLGTSSVGPSSVTTSTAANSSVDFERKLPLRPPSNRNLRRGRSHSPPRRAVSSGGASVATSSGARKAQYSLEVLQRERRKMSLMLGDEQFPADDVSAFLGDFSVSSAPTVSSAPAPAPPFGQDALMSDFPGVNLEAVKAIKGPIAQQKKQERKPEPKAKKLRKGEGSDQSEAQSKSAVSLAALEALERSAVAREKGELAKKLQAKRRHLVQQPESQTTSTTSLSVTSSGTASTILSSASPWDTQSKPQMSPRRNSLHRLRNLIHPNKPENKQFQEMQDSFDFQLETQTIANHVTVQEQEEGRPPEPSKQEPRKKKKEKQKKTKRRLRKNKAEAPPRPPATTATKPQRKPESKPKPPPTQRTSGGRDMQESDGSLSLSDLPSLHTTLTEHSQGSSRAVDLASSSSLKSPKKVLSKPTQTSSGAINSTRAQESSGSINSNRSFSSASSQDTFDVPENELPLDTSLDETVYIRSSSYGGSNTLVPESMLLDSLTLDTVHEANEDAASEATSRRTTSRSTSHSDHDSPKQSSIRRNSSSIHSIPERDTARVANRSSGSDEGRLNPSIEEEQQEEDNYAVRRGRTFIARMMISEDGDHDDDIQSEEDNNSRKTASSRKSLSGSSKRSKRSEHSPHGKGKKSKAHPRGLDVANRRPGSKEQKSEPPRRRLKAGGIVDDDEIERHSYSMNDIQAEPAPPLAASHSPRPRHHKSERKLVYKHDDKEIRGSSGRGDSNRRPRGGDNSRSNWKDDRGSISTSRRSHRSRTHEPYAADKSESHRSVSFRGGFDDHPDSVRFSRDRPYYDDYGWGRPFQPPPGYRGAPHGDNYDAQFHQYRNRYQGGHPNQNFQHRRHGNNNYASTVHGPFHPMERRHSFFDHQHRAFFMEDPRMYGGMSRGHQAEWRHLPTVHGDFGYEKPVHSRLDHQTKEAPRRGVVRRHSIGSGHSRESIMDEINSARVQEYKLSVCGFCGHIVSRCECSKHNHHLVEPITDISRHTRQEPRRLPDPMVTWGPRDLDTRLSSSGALPHVSLFDTFGIKYLDTDSGRRFARRMLDEEVHSGSHPSPANVPLYHRPDGFDVNEYEYSRRAARTSMSAANNHRGRRIRSSSERDLSVRKYGGRSVPVVDKNWSRDDSSLCYHQRSVGWDDGFLRYPQRSVAWDDGSLRYPRRGSFGGSVSGRTTLRSDDASLRSFAI